MTDQATPHRTLPPIQRRILGVLVEKAKTTPDAYPLSLNAIVTGCNQKSNRDPQMNVDEHAVEDALDALRHAGVVTEVQGSGRVPRYRHHIKEWLGVDGTEVAIVTELLLRGAQSVGDLRGRAARMATGQLTDVHALKPVLDSLLAKGLILELTPPGRGQWVTHALYPAQELDRVRREAHASPPPTAEDESLPVTPPVRTAGVSGDHELQDLRREMRELKEQFDRLTSDVAELRQLLS